jgi:hypothetical protein
MKKGMTFITNCTNNYYVKRNIKCNSLPNISVVVLSRAINFGRQCHFKIWLDCHKFKQFPCLIIPTSTKCQKIEKKMTINVIQHDDRL